jgi:hypothetical protein
MDNSVPIFNDSNVYILGAGFSRDAGLPLIADFTDRMRDALQWFSSKNQTAEVEAIQTVLRFRRRAGSATERVPLDLENIEEIFSLAAATSDLELNRSAALAIAATLEYTRVSSPMPQGKASVPVGFTVPTGWEHTGQFATSDGQFHNYRCPRYDVYAFMMAGPPEKSPDRHDTIISFNYDTLVEEGLSRLNIPFSYGFDMEMPDFDGSARCARQPASQEPKAVQVLKLHGSVNWAIQPAESKLLTVFGRYEDVRGRNLSPLLIPPTWRKDPATQLSDVWEKTVQALSTATRIAIIGYSIPPTDLHFKYLLAAGLQENISLRSIFFFNPIATSLQNHLDRVLKPDLGTQRVQLFDFDTKQAFTICRDRFNRLSQSGRWSVE